MLELVQYNPVQVIALLFTIDTYDGWRVNQRPPAIGDTGILIEILEGRGFPNKYVVESSDDEGFTIWLADFDAEELKPIDFAEYVSQRETRGTPSKRE